MKIYIVTNGQYDDYRIDSVFLDKDLAGKYVAVQNVIATYDEYRVEVKETTDEVDLTVHIYYETSASWDNVDHTLAIETRTITSLETSESYATAETWGQKSSKHKGLGKNPDGTWKYFREFFAVSFNESRNVSRVEAIKALRQIMSESGLDIYEPAKT